MRHVLFIHHLIGKVTEPEIDRSIVFLSEILSHACAHTHWAWKSSSKLDQVIGAHRFESLFGHPKLIVKLICINVN